MIIAALLLLVFSYGFVDTNFPFFQSVMPALLYRYKLLSALVYLAILSVLFLGYRQAFKRKFSKWMIVLVVIFLFSYPAFSYDIFNYIATAKVSFLYRENPYVVMPIEIPNEPMLAFTRASNKLALYGPTWIILTSFPYLLGLGNIVLTLFSFKLFVAAFYTAFVYLLFRKTKRWDATLFFALNPLVLVEVLVSGHNDIVMVLLAIAALFLWEKNQIAGAVLLSASVLVKGATVVLLPLLFLKDLKTKMRWGFWLMFGVFLLTPFREELYPWYAIWWLSFAAFIPFKKGSFIHWFSFWLSFGLMLRYVPWIATREYGGLVPMYRMIMTLLPVSLYVVYARKKA